jgi:hypothetical protein
VAGEKGVAAESGGEKPGGEGLASSYSGPTASSTVSISGPGGAPGISVGTLPPLKAEDLVYKVNADLPTVHTPSLVVTSGASGGGGLRIFGVLHGDRIYSVYYSMSGKNWILQYCVRGSAPKVDPSSHTVPLRIQPPVTPPGAIEQYDFRRPASTEDPANAMIVLHGTIREDGSVGDLEVLQGLDEMSNNAAKAAFARWKFKPASRGGTPVALEILVGIP